MRLSVISDQISDDVQEAFQTAAEEGYEFVELHNVWNKTIEELTGKEAAQIKTLLKDYHLSVSNIASTVFFVCPLYPTDYVSGFNESFHIIEGGIDDHLNHLKNACQVAQELECRLIRIFPFRFPDNRKPPFGDTADAEAIKHALLRASDIAMPYGVTLVVENCPYSHMPKGEMTLELIRSVNRENVRLLYDPANSYRAVVENVPERYRTWSLAKEAMELAPYIGHVHVKNYHYDPSVSPKPYLHVPCAEGDINYQGLIPLLQSHGYEGTLSLEPEVDRQGTISSMRWLKELFG